MHPSDSIAPWTNHGERPGPMLPAIAIRDSDTAEFLERLVGACSDFGLQLSSALHRTVREYTRGLIPPRAVNNNPHRERLALALHRFLSERGELNPDVVCQHLLERPVIQQADHSNLLLDQETFLNNFLFYMGCRAAGARIVITSQCSTVSCFSRRRPPTGPGYLYTRNTIYRVFRLSNSQLKSSNFCALSGPLLMAFDSADGTRPANRDVMLKRFVGRSVYDAPNAYRSCNDEIWSSLKLDHDYRRVGIDETVASYAAALHFRDPESPLRRLVFDHVVRDCFLRVKRRLVALPENLGINRAVPDFFWYRSDSRLLPVVLDGSGSSARFILEEGQSALGLDTTPKAFADALQSGVLYLDRILAYTIRCLLPGVVAIGGSVQQDYVAMYRRMLLETHAQTAFLSDDDVRTLQSDGLSRLGGRPILEPSPEEAEVIAMLGPDTDLNAFEAAIANRPLSQSIGRLSSVRFYGQILDKAEERSQ